jgi:hypothetical protein
MSDQESVGRTLYDLIGGFFRRDLAYIIGGGLFIFVADLFWSPELPEFSLADYYPFAWSQGADTTPSALGQVPAAAPTSSWLSTVVWILAAYVLGVLLSEVGDFLGVINKGKTLPSKYENQIDFYHANDGKREALKIHERSVGFMHLSSSVGTALIFGLLTVAAFCDAAHPGVWLGAALAAGGLAARWWFKRSFNFLCPTRGAAGLLSLTGDLLLVAGTFFMGLNMLTFRPRVFLTVFLSGLVFLQLSRVFSNRVRQEREAIDRLPGLDPEPFTAPQVQKKKTAK